MSEKLINYGGQAVIEGVMMRGVRAVAIAMRAPTREIVIHTEPLSGIYKSRIAKIPLLRGLLALWDALGLGTRALVLSANTQSEEKIEGRELAVSLLISATIFILVFILAPAGIGQLPVHFLKWSDWAGTLLEGLLRLALIVAYIWGIGKFPDVRRLFAYHGAEHKTINAFEAGAELTPETVAKYSIEHPRCGTAFLLTLVLLSVLLFSLLGPLPFWLKLVGRVLFLPILAGLAYEYIRWTANHLSSPLVRILVKPNLALQHLTTADPGPEMLEVAIAAFKAMRACEASTGENLERMAV